MNKEIKNKLNNLDFDNNKLIKINNNLYLTNNQIDILKRYNIDYKTSNSLRDLMIKIEDILDYEDDYEELVILLDNLSERNYYENTHKKHVTLYAVSCFAMYLLVGYYLRIITLFSTSYCAFYDP